jgi:hypothetical protein
MTIDEPSKSTDEHVKVIAVELYAELVAAVNLNAPPEVKSVYGKSKPCPRVAVLMSGPGWTTTSAPLEIEAVAPIVIPVDPVVKLQLGIGTPEMYAWTPEIVPVLPVGAELNVNVVPVAPVGIVVEPWRVIEYLFAVTVAPLVIVTELPVVSEFEPPISVQFGIAVPPTVTVMPLSVPIPKVDRFIVNDVPVAPVGTVVPDMISTTYGIFGGENVTDWLPFDTHDVNRLFVVENVVVSALSSHIVGDKSVGSKTSLYNRSSG